MKLLLAIIFTLALLKSTYGQFINHDISVQLNTKKSVLEFNKSQNRIPPNNYRIGTADKYVYLLDSILSLDTRWGREWAVYFYDNKGRYSYANSWCEAYVEYNYNTTEVQYTDFGSISAILDYSKKITGYPQWDTINKGNLDLEQIFKYDNKNRYSGLYYYGMFHSLYWAINNFYDNNNDLIRSDLLDDNLQLDNYLINQFDNSHNDTLIRRYSKKQNYPNVFYPSMLSRLKYDIYNRFISRIDYDRSPNDSNILVFNKNIIYEYDNFGNIKKEVQAYSSSSNIRCHYYRAHNVLDSTYYYSTQATDTTLDFKKLNFYSSPTDTLADSTNYLWANTDSTWMISKRRFYQYDSLGIKTQVKSIIYYSSGLYDKTIIEDFYYSFHKISDSPKQKQITSNNAFDIYPTVFNNQLVIHNNATSPQGYTIYIVDLSGRIVFQKAIGCETSTNLNLNHLPTGLYLYKIVPVSGEIEQGKVIKL